MLKDLNILKREVCRANQMLPALGLVLFTWGNVSAIDPSRRYVVIKPSGVAYEQLTPESMVVVDMDGRVVEGDLNPSSDTPTHLELYKAFPGIGGITHTHSKWATIWSQRGRPIPALGTTHADSFDGQIPVTREMTKTEIKGEYERNTGLVIVEAFQTLDPMRMPAVLVKNHGPFCWGRTAAESVEHAAVLEYVAEMAAYSEGTPMPEDLLRRHFDRKHGPGAYYGQKQLFHDIKQTGEST